MIYLIHLSSFYSLHFVVMLCNEIVFHLTILFFLFTDAGYNGTIDGQGQAWWMKFRKKLLKHTRGPLVQIMWSSDIHISNITFRNSPFWTLHPYDCTNVTISNVTILAPLYGAPNTDGIDPGTFAFSVIFVISLENLVDQ